MHTLYTCMHKHTRMYWIGISEMKQWKLVHPLEMNSPNPRYVSYITLILIAKVIIIIILFNHSMFSIIKGIYNKGEFRMCYYGPYIIKCVQRAVWLPALCTCNANDSFLLVLNVLFFIKAQFVSRSTSLFSHYCTMHLLACTQGHEP